MGNTSCFGIISLPLGVPPLGECPKDKGGAASGEEKVSPKVTDEGLTYQAYRFNKECLTFHFVTVGTHPHRVHHSSER